MVSRSGLEFHETLEVVAPLRGLGPTSSGGEVSTTSGRGETTRHRDELAADRRGDEGALRPESERHHLAQEVVGEEVSTTRAALSLK